MLFRCIKDSVYIDEGITGTTASRRPEFMRMLADCDTGKIDIILTKSISRFARNTVDLLETIRHLKDIGTGDCVIVGDGTLSVIDFKYGVGIVAEADKRMSLDAVCQQMGRTPPWAEGLLLRTDGYETVFTKKIDSFQKSKFLKFLKTVAITLVLQ